MKQTNRQQTTGKRKNKSKNKKPQRSIDHMLSSNNVPIIVLIAKTPPLHKGINPWHQLVYDENLLMNSF